MKKSITNTFKIQNLSDLNFSYKLVSIEIAGLAKDNAKEWNQAIKKARLALSSKIEGVAVPLYIDGTPYLVIPSDKSMPENLTVETNPLPAVLKLIPEVHNITDGTATKQEKKIIYNFLDFAIKQQLGRIRALGKTGNYDFIDKNNWRNKNGVDVFQGFSYRLVEDEGFALVLDTKHLYLEQECLADLINIKNKNSRRSEFINKRFLYLNGDRWYPIEVKGFANPISEQPLPQSLGDFSCVQDYILHTNRNSRFEVAKQMKSEDLSLLYGYLGREMQPHVGATSLAKKILLTDDKRVKSIHRDSINKPHIRFQKIATIIEKYFQNIFFNGKKLDVSLQPKEDDLKYYKFPPLKFNTEAILKIGSPKKSGGKVGLEDIPSFRKKAIETVGILKQGSFSPQYLLVPHYWDKPLATAVHQTFYNELKRLAADYVSFEDFKLITYKFDDRISASQQIDNIKEMLKKIGADGGKGIFILPEQNKVRSRYLSNFHDLLKQKFAKELWFQCASASTIEKFFMPIPSRKNDFLTEYIIRKEKDNSFKSYLFYLAIEFFTLQRKWAYSLANPLNYDIYIGMDSGGRNVGFCIFFKNGEDIYFDYVTVPKQPFHVRTERLQSDKIVEALLPILKRRIPKCAPKANGLIGIKDGKSYGEFAEAIKVITESLKNDELISDENFKWGVVDLRKNTATPLRMAIPTNSYEGLENPQTGAYKTYMDLEEPEGFLFNTGFPFRVGGSVKPIQFILREGNVDFEKIMQDMYHQSMMPFSAPNLANKLPACIKLIDSFLGHTGTAYDERDFREKRKEEKASVSIT